MATLTLRNVPDELVARLKARAKRHRRSLNNETIAALELADATATGATPLPAEVPVDLDTTLRRMEEIRAGLRSKAAAEGREILLLPPPPLLTPKQIQAQRKRFAEQRSGFKGPPPTSKEIIEVIERENHPPDDDLLATPKRLDY
jgi:plasmid stability protein